MADRKLHLETEAAARLKEKLIATYGEDDELIADMIEGSTGLHEAIGHAALELAAVEGEKEGIKNAIAKLKARLTRYSERATGLRDAIQTAMETAEIKTLRTAAATLTVKASPPSVEITDAALLPPIFLTQPPPPPPTPDKAAIRDAIKSGEAIPGAVLSNQPPALTVRYS